MMDPSVGLLAASGLASFLLKTTAEWMVCLLLVRIAGSARIRFNLWLTMLLGFVAQWVWMWVGVARAAFPATTQASGAGGHTVGGARFAVAASIAAAVAQAMVVLLAGYLAVVAWRLAGSLIARVRLARAMRHKGLPPERLATTFLEAMEQTGAGDGARGWAPACELWVLPGLASPATLGWWKPRVIVPPVCQTQDTAELKVVFWHELKHVERRDALWNALVRACRNLLWFHPCVHHAAAALNAERELACDAAVVREHPHSRDMYASCLVRFARARDLQPVPAAMGIEMASGAALLTARVRTILSEGQGLSRFSRAWRTAVGMALVSVMAATVPAMNILFAAELSQTAMLLPDAGDAGVVVGRSARPAGARVRTAAAGQTAGGGAIQVPGTIAIVHDEQLAATHRAAMEILTESTGMDTPAAEGDLHALAGVEGVGRRGSAGMPSSPSWASVAVDAAEHMGPLMGDHDGDGHHFR